MSFDGEKPAPSPKPAPRQSPTFRFIGVFGIVLIVLIAVAVYLFFDYRNNRYYEAFQPYFCNVVLRNNPCVETRTEIVLSQHGSPVLAEQSVLEDWIEEAREPFVLENKFRALDINYSNTSDSDLNTGNDFLGIYEREIKKRPIEAGVHFLLAGSNGDFDARELFRDLALNQAQKDVVRSSFESIHKLNGGEGYFRLGQMYLANNALNLPNNPAPYLYPTTEPPYASHIRFDFNVDFLGREPDASKSYVNMQIAVLCGVTEAIDWRRYIETAGNLSGRSEALRRQAADELEAAGRNTEGGIEAYCEGRNLRQRIELLTDPAVIWRFLADRRPWPEYGELVQRLRLSDYEFCEWIGVLVTEAVDLYGYEEKNGYPRFAGTCERDASLRGRSGSPYYRNSPGADSTSRSYYGGAPNASDGLADDCQDVSAGTECPDRYDELVCRNEASARLNLGKAYLAVGNIRDARKSLQLANDEGRKCQAPAARQAAKLLQALNLTCEYSEESLARISRDALNSEDGAIISLNARQRALSAYGHYDGNIDGKYGPMTREAVTRFQNEYGFDETGDLTPIETVYLICGAAEVKSDAASMNMLGVMYLTGLGVVQNTDAGLDWLKQAGERYQDPPALYNLALVYGTGTIVSSYKLCAVPENLQRADSYLVQAANLGYGPAQRLVNKYGSLLVSDRWEKIKAELELDEFHKQHMESVGEACQPNPD